MNLPMKQKETHRHREQTCGCQGGWGGKGKDWKSGIGRYKLLCIGWINNKVLLHRMGNYIQHPIINHRGFPGGSDGKESTCYAGDLGLIPGLGRSPEGRHGNLLQCSCFENPHAQRCLAGDSPWGLRESDMTERLSTHKINHNGKDYEKEYIFYIFISITWL